MKFNIFTYNTFLEVLHVTLNVDHSLSHFLDLVVEIIDPFFCPFNSIFNTPEVKFTNQMLLQLNRKARPFYMHGNHVKRSSFFEKVAIETGW